MARLAVLLTVSFLLFSFSDARFITVEPEHDVSPPEETVTDLPEPKPKNTNTILLSDERPGFESIKRADIKHDDDASKAHSDVESVPLTMISFHPINRHFPRHNCRFHKRFRLLNPRFQQKRFISYGNDMILSDERPRFHLEPRGVVHHIQARWARFPDDGVESKERVDFIKLHHHDHDHKHEHDEDHHYHHFHHQHHRHHHHGEEDERNEREGHEGGFMEKFRKFLSKHF